MSTLSTKYDRSFALIVGINAYEKLNPLLGAVNDAYNTSDLLAATQFGIALVTPKEFLQRMGELA